MRNNPRSLFLLSLLFTLLTILILANWSGWFAMGSDDHFQEFAPVNEAGDPLLAVVSGTPIYGNTGRAGSGIAIEPPQLLPDFTLVSQNEQALSLSDFRGKYVLLFFGYTNCPDVCPLTLDSFRRIHAELSEDQIVQLSFLLISVDGARDTTERLREYLAAFDVPVTALRGDEAEIAVAGEAFGLVVQIVEPGSEMAMSMSAGHGQDHPVGEEEYLIDHTSSRFLIDPEGQLIRRYWYSPDPAASATLILADLRNLIQELN